MFSLEHRANLAQCAPLFISVDRNSAESLFLIDYGNTVFFAVIAMTVLLHDYHLRRSSSINSTVFYYYYYYFYHYCYYIYLLFIVVVSATVGLYRNNIFNIIFFFHFVIQEIKKNNTFIISVVVLKSIKDLSSSNLHWVHGLKIDILL